MAEKTQKIKAILFDFMGVLLFPRADYKRDKIVDEIDYAIGKVTDDKLFKKETIKKYNLNKTEFNAVLDKIVDKYEPFEPLWSLLPQIRKNYKLAIINNGTSLTLPKFKSKYYLNNIFDFFVSSAIEGFKKPNRRIYELTIRKLGFKPEECLFMDDSLLNVDKAKKLGMSTIYWESPQIGFKKFQEFIDITEA
ncbi:MAG: HAD-IA family hydrolase [Patescibacteria group bacterium]|jgi:HAD superfamily hydrolase (TIGR01509 family)